MTAVFKNSALTRALAFLFVFATVFYASSMSLPPASALSNNVHDILFDWEYYYNSYSDLRAAFGANPTALRQHWDQYGKREGRSPSRLFSAPVYLSLYPDLRSAFGNDYTAAYNHFCSNGIAEGRKASNYFHVSVYKQNYSDLRNAFGNNNLLYLKHYREYGYREGRNATSAISQPQSTQTSSGTSGSSNQSKITNSLNAMINGSSYSGAYKLGKRYTGPYYSEQCKGFAKSVHMKLFGYNIGSTKGKPNNYQISYSSSKTRCLGSVNGLTASRVKSLFSSARPGDFVQMRRSHGGSHSAIVYSVSSSGVTWIEANLDGRNTIVKRTYSWSSLCSSNVAMSVYTAKNY